jgi:Big-like domain-containing protein
VVRRIGGVVGVVALIVGTVLAVLAPPASAALPVAQASQGSWHVTGPVTVDTTAGTISGTTFLGVVQNGVMTFTFDSVQVDAGALVTVVGSRPLALFSTGDIGVAGNILAAGADGDHGGLAGAGGGGGPGVGSPGSRHLHTAPSTFFDSGGGGGGYGGAGGAGGADPDGVVAGGPGGGAWGDLHTTLVGGSNGGGTPDGGVGGGAGGAVELSAVGTLTVDGTISVDGGDGATAPDSVNHGGGGGGSGGGIILDAAHLGLGGILSASGGDGANAAALGGGGGGGGGGRILLRYGDINATFSERINGGLGGLSLGSRGANGVAGFEQTVRTTTHVAGAPSSPSAFGQPITLTATVCAGSGATPPPGAVDFTDGTTDLGTAILSAVASEQCPGVGASTASITTAALPVGDSTISASYSPPGITFAGSVGSLPWHVDRAPTSTTVSTSPSPSAQGDVVTFTSTTCASGASTAPPAAPTGTVTFSEGSTVLGSAPVAGGPCGTASLTTSSLAPGSHTITASYGGDANFAGSTGTVGQVVNCPSAGTLTTLTVSRGTTCLSNTTVRGTVTVAPGATLVLTNSYVGGSVIASRPADVTLCGDTVVGSVSVNGATGSVVVGSPADGCAGNTMGGATFSGNHGGTTIGGNTISGSLSCTGNVPPATDKGSPNSVAGARTGECASPSF